MIDESRQVISLNGLWRYRKDEKGTGVADRFHEPATDISGWRTMDIPSNWYLTEVGSYHGVIWFARDFEFRDDPAGREHRLVFHGIDYIGEVWLNGKHLGGHEGYFAPFALSTLGSLRRGSNRLVVRVDSPYDDVEYREIPKKPGAEWPVSDEYKERWPVGHTLVKGSLLNFYHRPGHRTKFGQDANTGGIWQDVELASHGLVYIAGVKITPHLVRDALHDDALDGTAILSIKLRIVNAADRPRAVVLRLEARGSNFSGGEEIEREKALFVQPGLNTVRVVHTVAKPRLWWCWDHGDPNLYLMTLTLREGDVVLDRRHEKFGIREIRVDGVTGQWYLNGQRVFVRGMRYFSSQWGSEVTRDLLEQDLGRMRELAINAVRVGSHVEKMAFYRLCDELGIMVWQVMPFHWGNWSDSDDLIERAAPMMAELVDMLHNCPSLAVWSTYKEPLIFPFDDPPNLVGRLCETLKRTAMAEARPLP
jgi:beta-mannosidase